VSFQQYIRTKELKPFQIFSMKAMIDPDLSKEEFREEDLEIVDTEKKKHMYSCEGDISNDVNR